MRLMCVCFEHLSREETERRSNLETRKSFPFAVPSLTFTTMCAKWWISYKSKWFIRALSFHSSTKNTARFHVTSMRYKCDPKQFSQFLQCSTKRKRKSFKWKGIKELWQGISFVWRDSECFQVISRGKRKMREKCVGVDVWVCIFLHGWMTCFNRKLNINGFERNDMKCCL